MKNECVAYTFGCGHEVTNLLSNIGDSEMKTRTILFISALLALTSCGSAARYAGDASRQKYQDGIYYTSKSQTHQAEEAAVSANEEETDLLVAKTKNSPIFMKSGEKVDTLFIPENKTARIDFNNTDNTTSVYLYDNGFDAWAAYQPWYATSWYSWYRPFYTSIYWGPILGTTADGTRRGAMTLGTMDIMGMGRPVVLQRVVRPLVLESLVL